MNFSQTLQQKDFASGLLLVAIGVVGALYGREYPMGTAAQMGPGYFPMALSIGVLTVGAVLTIKSFFAQVDVIERIHWRSVCAVVLAIVLFGLTVERAGLAVAIFLLVAVGALGGRENRLKEVVLAYIGLTLASAALFVVGLGLPIRILPL